MRKKIVRFLMIGILCMVTVCGMGMKASVICYAEDSLPEVPSEAVWLIKANAASKDAREEAIRQGATQQEADIVAGVAYKMAYDKASQGASDAEIKQVALDSVAPTLKAYRIANSVMNEANNENIDIQASTKCIISAGASEGGTISDAGDTTHLKGTNVTYTITPYKGYMISYVSVDGISQGAIGSYTFQNLQGNHTIQAYFTKELEQRTEFALCVFGSVDAYGAGSGNYKPGTKVTIRSGARPGYAFAGWIVSDGRVLKNATETFEMPQYDLVVYAKWRHTSGLFATQAVTTTNLKNAQITGWPAIAAKLDTLTVTDLTPGSQINILDTKVAGISCYIEQDAVAHLDKRAATVLRVKFGSDTNVTFYSDNDNSQYVTSDFAFLSTDAVAGNNPQIKEKRITFKDQGSIGTAVCINTYLPNATPGSVAYVYLVTGQNTILYLPVTVDAGNTISIPVIAKVNLLIQYN